VPDKNARTSLICGGQSPAVKRTVDRSTTLVARDRLAVTGTLCFPSIGSWKLRSRAEVSQIARRVASRSLTAGSKRREQENEEKRKRKEGNLCNLGKNNAYSRTTNGEAVLQP